MHALRTTYPLSRKIPALLTSTLIPPKASIALCITAAPSVTEDVFMMAFPPADNERRSDVRNADRELRTSFDFVDYALGCFSVKVVYDNIGTAGGKQKRISGKERCVCVKLSWKGRTLYRVRRRHRSRRWCGL